MRVPARLIGTLVTALFAAFLLVILLTLPAAAHSVLLETDPAADTQLAGAPAEVSLRFNEDITDLGTQVVVTGPDGEVISEGETQVKGPVISQPLADERPDGAYVVTWRAVSADGHPISGEYTFTATEAVGVPEAEETDTSEEASEQETTAEETTPATEVGHDPSASPVLKWVIGLGAAAAVVAIVAAVIAKRRDLGE